MAEPEHPAVRHLARDRSDGIMSTEVKDKFQLAGPITIGRRKQASFVAPSSVASAPAVKSLTQREWALRYRMRLLVSDSVIVVGAILTAFAFRFGIDGTLPDFAQDRYLLLSGLIVAVWLVFLASTRSRDARILGSGVTEYRRVVNSSAFAFGILAITFLILKVDIARGFFILALPIGTLALLVERWLWRKWLVAQRRAGTYLARAVVVGKRDDVEYVIKQITDRHSVSYDIVGASVVDEDLPHPIATARRQVPVVSHVDGVAQAAANLSADAVIIAGPVEGGSDYVRRLGWDLEGTATELVLAARLTDVAGPRIHFRPVEGLPLIHVEIPQFEGGHHILKRALDVTLTTIGLIVIAPFLAIIALLVKLDSPGPAMFAQERVGRNGERFTMYKFRSMVVDAETALPELLQQSEGNGMLFKMKNDPRVTRVGRVLRKFSLDEFPQLWNVLTGDMSLVGPRPPLVREVEGYERDAHRRLHIKPGLTGMWQVSGRSDLSWEESVRLDLYYVENWSITGDLMILWQTVKVVLRPVGAY
ncbi:sugar transferase [Plantibacter sp. YIM 135249]|jgi:exopolysaccharide biosynthesis polyprenyl glycosylphosphotransferase|uniref:sugar transferase n=1 Tax=Plantibacter sp. YIM 135249 TaxID=3423918 RepID=UPI003D33252F